MLRLQHPRSHMSSKPAPVFHREALAWGVLLALALAAACWWWAIGRPVNLPDAPSSRIACVSYAPFREPGESPLDATAFISPARIDGDLRALSQRFDCVRTYSQGQGLSAVPQIAGRYGMQVLLGIWLGHDPQANAEQIRLGIATARKYPQVVRAVIVGNEVLLRGDLSSAQLAAERAVQHVAAGYARVRQAFPDKRVMIGETGWPSAGRSRQAASASVVNEARYLREFLRYAAKEKLPYNVIEAFDQPWKRALEGTAGGYWGIFDVQARPKFPMQGPVTEDPRWWLGWLAAGAGGAWFVLAGGWRRHRRCWRDAFALGLAGIASGGALAWQWRQMLFACRDAWEWTVSLAACAVALLTAMRLARWIAARLSGVTRSFVPGRLRLGWMLALAYYGLLLVFDGRYRDFPLGLFLLPCVGYALAGSLTDPSRRALPRLEERFLAAWLPLLGTIVLVQEAGLNPVAWLWLAVNLLLVLPVLLDWRAARIRLQAQQA